MDSNDCWNCEGTGIGNPHEGTACCVCNGSGIIDKTEYDEYEEDWVDKKISDG
jgi:DnaJ-class molecular chaperone